MKVKRSSLIQEGIRRLRNCHEDVPEEEVNGVLTDYMKKMQNSGFSEEFRRDCLHSGLNGFEKQKEADRRGETPLYRPRGYQKSLRVKNKKEKKSSWFKKGKNHS